MHDKYCYESIEMALHDRDILRTMAFGMAGRLARRRQPLGHQVRQGETDPRRHRLDRGLQDRRRVPLLRQLRRSRRQHRRVDRFHVHEQGPEVPDLPQRGSHAIGADHHVERGVRQSTGQHARRPAARASRSRPAPIRRTARTRMACCAAALSVAKLPYDDCQDGISLTISIVPTALGTQGGALRAPVERARRVLRRRTAST